MNSNTIFNFYKSLFISAIIIFGSIIVYPQLNANNQNEIQIEYPRPRIITKTVLSGEDSNNSLSLFSLERLAFEMINKKRAEFGLEALNWSDEVAKLARSHSEEMAKNRFFSHSGLNGKLIDERADEIRLGKWRAIGENIAFNRGFQNPVGMVIEKWLQSESHRKNLLNSRWKETGLGIAKADDGTYYFTQVFLQR